MEARSLVRLRASGESSRGTARLPDLRSPATSPEADRSFVDPASWRRSGVPSRGSLGLGWMCRALFSRDFGQLAGFSRAARGLRLASRAFSVFEPGIKIQRNGVCGRLPPAEALELPPRFAGYPKSQTRRRRGGAVARTVLPPGRSPRPYASHENAPNRRSGGPENAVSFVVPKAWRCGIRGTDVLSR